MKASELINELVNLISVYGDQEVCMPDAGIKSVFKDEIDAGDTYDIGYIEPKTLFILEEE